MLMAFAFSFPRGFYGICNSRKVDAFPEGFGISRTESFESRYTKLIADLQVSLDFLPVSNLSNLSTVYAGLERCEETLSGFEFLNVASIGSLPVW
jgi:hypothetical protein